MNNPFEELREEFNDKLSKIESILIEIISNQQIQQPQSPEFLYSLKDVAAFLNCSIATCHKWKKSGIIPCNQIGRKLIFNTSEILKSLDKHNKNKHLRRNN